MGEMEEAARENTLLNVFVDGMPCWIHETGEINVDERSIDIPLTSEVHLTSCQVTQLIEDFIFHRFLCSGWRSFVSVFKVWRTLMMNTLRNRVGLGDQVDLHYFYTMTALLLRCKSLNHLAIQPSHRAEASPKFGQA